MTYIISVSGGMGSAITWLAAHERGVDYVPVFADTLIEDEDLYRFLRDLEAATGRELVWLKDGRTPWDVYRDRKWIGNSRMAHCSTELKTNQVKAWAADNCNDSDPLVLGMDWSEQDRIDRAATIWSPRPVVSLLNEFKISRPEFDLILNRYKIKKPRLYAMGYEHNNCGGFCCKAGLVQFERLFRTMPERYQWHEEQMEAVMAGNPKAKPFLRQHQGGEVVYLSLLEFREQLEAGSMELPMFDEAGCGCFTDG